MSFPAPPLDVPAFDLTGPLPAGVTVLEASAGTGKTYAIASLAARYVAEGTPLEQVLMITFTRMATGELRERVRERLLQIEQRLGQSQLVLQDEDDAVLELLGTGSQAEVQRRRRRLRRALAQFDAATIATTHRFCQEVLSGLGVAGDLEPEAELVEDLDDLVTEVLDDLYVRRALSGPPPFTRSEALAIARLSIANPEAEIVAADGEPAAARVRLAERARRELEARKRRLSVMGYDDLLTRLAAALRGPAGEDIARRLQGRYSVVLVDEFQDTDPIQWEIVHRAFGSGQRPLVLIADPKQAIYAFRGADVYAYLNAAALAGGRATLGVNRRSDQRLLDGFDALFDDARLGHEGIAYRRVSAAAAGQGVRFRRAPHEAALRIRVLDRAHAGMTPSGYARAPAARTHVAEDLAADLVSLLDSGAQVRPASGAEEWEQVCPAHVAVLAPRNYQAELVRDTLHAAGIPAVTGGAGSVFATEAAGDWLALLEALERPASISRAHAVALTPFLGLSAQAVAARTEAEWGALHRRLHDWARVLRTAGVAAVWESISRGEQLPARMLARPGGERRLTDLRHVNQLLHAAAHAEGLGTAALAAWLRRRMAEGADHAGDEDRSRRLESDADAVQVLTIHRSKGLEFPIVLLPFMWDVGRERPEEPVCFHDPGAGYRRRLDVSLDGGDFGRHRKQSVVEQRGEDLRLLYVALTRARHQVVLWWAGSYDSCHSPLSRLVFGNRNDGMVDPYGPRVPTDERALTAFRTVAERAPDHISVEVAQPGLPREWSPPLAPPAPLGVATCERELDLRWRRTSYSNLTAVAHDSVVGDDTAGRVGSEPGVTTVHDEPAGSAPGWGIPDVPAGAGEAWNAPSPMAGLPVGTTFGTLVHEVLQLSDFAAADLDAELAGALSRARARPAVELADSAELLSGLRAAIETPLGAQLGELRLRDVAQPDRLDELEFELPLAGGDTPRGTVTTALLGRVLLDRLEATDPLRGYAELLARGDLGGRVRGYLTGFLDLVVRLPGPRFAVIDYKTNWLAGADDELRIGHYHPAVLRTEMERRHYPLQALLYLVALHRYLRWRLHGYDPDHHLAGVAYAFVRGMNGAETPAVEGTPAGVFAWEPPPGLIDELSTALDTGVSG